MTSAQLQKILADTAERVTGDTLTVPTVKAYLDDWLKGVTTRNEASTVERYENTVALFFESLKTKSQLAVTSVTPKDVETFVNARLESVVAPKTAIIASAWLRHRSGSRDHMQIRTPILFQSHHLQYHLGIPNGTRPKSHEIVRFPIHRCPPSRRGTLRPSQSRRRRARRVSDPVDAGGWLEPRPS